MKKRLIALLCTFFCLFEFAHIQIFALTENSTAAVEIHLVPICSNEYNEDNIAVYLSDGELYLSIPDVCKLTRSVYEYDFDNDIVEILHGCLSFTIDEKKDELRLGNDKSECKMIKYKNTYLIRPHAVLCLLCARCGVNEEKNTILVNMPYETIYELVENNKSEELHTHLYNADNKNSLMKYMMCSIAMDCIFNGFGNLLTKKGTDYFDAALCDVTKLDVMSYNNDSSLQERLQYQIDINNRLLDIYGALSENTKTITDAIKDNKLKLPTPQHQINTDKIITKQ